MKEQPPSFGAHVAALVALAVLLGLTVLAAKVHLGTGNVIAGPGIAAVKAGIVLFFFMKVRRSGLAIRFAAGFGFVWLAILIALTLADFLTRVPLRVT